ncbi:MAG: hypothetical protein ABSB35_33105 [Bryobacteraceae bacterium]|jgi:tetratricopeptide (TPR) repeat protein
MNDLYQSLGTYALLAALTVLSVWMNLRSNRPRLYSQIGILFCIFLGFTNGFAVQYLAWLVPWVVELGLLPTSVFLGASGVVLFLLYNLESNGLWYYAPFEIIFEDKLAVADTLCWLSVLFAVWIAWGRLRGSAPSGWRPAFHRLPLTAKMLAGLLVFGFLGIAIARQSSAQSAAPAQTVTDKERPVVVEVQSDLLLSTQLYSAGRNREAVSASKDALALMSAHSTEPGFASFQAIAYYMIAAAQVRLGEHDQAIYFAQQALRMQPGFEEAKALLQALLERTRPAALRHEGN